VGTSAGTFSDHRTKISKTGEPLYSSKSGFNQKECKREKHLWNVTEESMPVLNPHTHLERTSKRIAGIDATTVATRICECLRTRSVESNYDDANATATCLTLGSVKFEIHLFRGDNGEVILETQRRSGNSIDFSKERRAIFEAVIGNGVHSIEKEFNEQLPPSQMACLKDVSTEENLKQKEQWQASSRFDIVRIQNLLEENTTHSTYLALRFLSNMSDLSSVFTEEVSKNILIEGEVIQSKIIRIIEDDFLYPLDDQYDTLREMKLLTLSVIEQALSTLSMKGSMKIVSEQHWILNKLVPYLFVTITNAAERPHDASIAIGCLRFLMENSYKVFLKVNSEETLSLLKHATQIGSKAHAYLEKQAASILPSTKILSNSNN